MKELEGKVALVTGAARGIGRAIALQFAQMGATVVINYSGSKEKAEEVLSKVRELGADGCTYQCNVADFEAVGQMMADVVQKYNKIDILVNNAGITKDGLLMKMSEEDFDAVVNVNLKGTFNCIRQVTRQMLKQRGGRIINMSSIVGIMGNAGQVNYSATKAGVIGITKSVAKELASRGITVNAIAPGYVQTDMTDVLSDSVKEKIVNTIPLNRMGQSEDIAKTVGFLASEGAAYITGQVISVDGGMSIN